MNHWALWIAIVLFMLNALFTFVKNIKNDKNNVDIGSSIFVFLVNVTIAVFAITELV